MLQVSIPTIEWQGDIDGKLKLIDQTKLPEKLEYIICDDLEGVWQAIRRLSVRGAPAIGIAAAYGVVVALQKSSGETGEDLADDFTKAVEYLESSRPTAVNLFWALDQMKATFEKARGGSADEVRKTLLERAQAIQKEDFEMCRSIGASGLPFVPEKARILTHCNAGGLATAGYGTALGVIYMAAEAGRELQVYADETRPLLQGSRLTAWELQHAEIPVTVICDSMAGMIMAQKKIDMIIVGADRIAANGDTANKIGTYSLAVLARAHGIPFYVAAPSNTFDLSLETGDEIPIEERENKEISNGYGRQTAPYEVQFYNPAFDVTPADYIAAIFTEKGVIEKPNRERIMDLLG